MKKLLALVLALVMTLSLATVSTNAAFEDAKDISADYEEAVEVLNALGIFKGYDDGKTFQPKGDITRAEVATILYRIATADTAKNDKSGLYATYNKFNDMAGASWAAGYIGYCANAELVKGYPDGTFQPSGKVTGYEVLAMILRAVGYDQNDEFTGADWALNVAKVAEANGLFDNVAKTTDLGAAASRELVAELLFAAVTKANLVTYTAAFGYQTEKFTKDSTTIGEKTFKLSYKYEDGAYGRPIKQWYTGSSKLVAIDIDPVATYEAAVTECDLCKDLGEKTKAVASQIWTDGVKAKTTDTYKATETKDVVGAQGQITEVYEEADGYRFVHINTYLAKVTKVIDEVVDKNDHVRVEASVNVTVYGAAVATDSYATAGFEKGDMVLVTYDNGDIASMELAEGKVGKLTSVKGEKHVGGTTENIANVLKVAYEDVTIACKATINPLEGNTVALGSTYTFYYDSFGNIIGVDSYTADADYAVVDKIWADHENGNSTVYANLVLTDATMLEKVVVDTNDRVNVNAAANNNWYHDLGTYTVNEDGEYELDLLNVGTKVAGEANAYPCYYNAENDDDAIYVLGAAGNVYLDKETVVLFQYTDSPNGDFKSYTLENLPAEFVGYVEYVAGSNGKADVVYVRGIEMAMSYVFVTDPTDVTTAMNSDKTVTLTLNGVLVVEDGKLVEKDLKVTGPTENIVADSIDGYLGDYVGLTALEAAGLYRVLSFGENNSVLIPVMAKRLDVIRDFGGNEVLGVYGNQNWIEVSDDDLYTYWIGDYNDDEGNAYATKLTQEDDPNVTGLAAGDWVYVQYDEDDNVVAVFEVDFAVSVEFAEGWEEIDENATISAPVMYYGKETKDFTVSVSKWVKVDSVNNGYAVSTEKEHSEARTFAAKAQYKIVDGDIVVTLAADPAHTEAWLELNDVTSQNLTVTLNNGENKIVVTTSEAGTIKVNDVTAFLKAAGTHNQGFKVYNNTIVNPVEVNGTANFEIDNMFVVVTAENGTTVTYTFTAGSNA